MLTLWERGSQDDEQVITKRFYRQHKTKQVNSSVKLSTKKTQVSISRFPESIRWPGDMVMVMVSGDG